MRYSFGFLCVLALGVASLCGCSETTGDGGTGGDGGMAGSGGTGGDGLSEVRSARGNRHGRACRRRFCIHRGADLA